MGIRKVYIHEFTLPELDFLKKYYFLISSLLFEFEPNGYYEDRLKIKGFTKVEAQCLWHLLDFAEQESDTTLLVRNFDISLLPQMISVLPSEQQEQLADHIVLSSIDNGADFTTLSANLKNNIHKFGSLFPAEYFSNLDFLKFFRGGESSFMNEYYPTNELKDEIRMQYRLKR